MAHTTHTFRKFCQAQGVELHEDINRYIDAKPDYPARKLVGVIGGILADPYPPERLADRPFAVLPTNDTAAAITCSMINDSILGNPDAARLPQFNRECLDVSTTCGTSEVLFANLFGSVLHGEAVSGRVFVASDGESVLYQKEEGTDVALTLSPLLFKGVGIYPGTLVDIAPHRVVFRSYQLVECPLQQVKGIHVLRLSGFAYPTAERQRPTGHYVSFTEAREEAYAKLEPSDLAGYACRAQVQARASHTSGGWPLIEGGIS